MAERPAAADEPAAAADPVLSQCLHQFQWQRRVHQALLQWHGKDCKQVGERAAKLCRCSQQQAGCPYHAGEPTLPKRHSGADVHGDSGGNAAGACGKPSGNRKRHRHLLLSHQPPRQHCVCHRQQRHNNPRLPLRPLWRNHNGIQLHLRQRHHSQILLQRQRVG